MKMHWLDPHRRLVTCCGRSPINHRVAEFSGQVTCGRCRKTEPWLKERARLGHNELAEAEEAGALALHGLDAEVPGSEPWERPAYMDIDPVDALSAVALYEHLLVSGFPSFDCMRSVLSAYREAL